MRRKVFLMSSAAGAVAAALRTGGMGAALASVDQSAADSVELPFANGSRRVAVYPQKRPLLVLTSRPVQLETPFAVFDEDVFTPNDAFFVRWHLAGVPTSVDTRVFRLRVHGNVERELSLSLDDLRAFPPAEVAAVCECSGNSRGFVSPRVPGGQWANGAMGNARWRGARLRDVLDRAGVKSGSVQVRLDGADGPVLPTTPDFKKSLDLDVARAEDTIIAYAMNGEALPLLNGFPVRLVVPGYFATYWVKMLDDVEVLTKPDDNFWMKTAYRIPDNENGSVQPGATNYKTRPIGKLTVRSFITSHTQNERISPGLQLVRGIAFDAGSGIDNVVFSAGIAESRALLGPSYGPYSFREWTASFTAERGTQYALRSRATARSGEIQPLTAGWNPSGYQRNVVETVAVQA